MGEQMYYTSKEVMELLHVKSYNTLRRWEREKILVPIKSKFGRYLYPKEAIEKYIEEAISGV